MSEKVIVVAEIEIDVADTGADLIKVAGREVAAGINSSLDQNQNVEDIRITVLEANVQLVVNCLPDEEIAELAQ